MADTASSGASPAKKPKPKSKSKSNTNSNSKDLSARPVDLGLAPAAEGSSSKRPISPMPKGKGRKSKGKGVAGAVGGASGTTVGSNRSERSVRASARLQALKDTPNPSALGESSATSLDVHDAGPTNDDDAMLGDDEAGGEDFGEFDEFDGGEEEDYEAGGWGEEEEFGDGMDLDIDETSSSNMKTPATNFGYGSSLGLHTDSSEFQGKTKEEMVDIRAAQKVELDRKRDLALQLKRKRDERKEEVKRKRREKGKGREGEDDDEVDAAENNDVFNGDAAPAVEAEGRKEPVPAPAAADPKEKKKKKKKAPRSRTAQPELAPGTLIKIGQGESFKHPKKMWVELLEEGDADPAKAAGDPSTGAEPATTPGASSATPQTTENDTDREKPENHPKAGETSTSFASGSNQRRKPLLKVVDAPTPHQYFRIIKQSGKGRLRVYKAQGITRRKEKKRKDPDTAGAAVSDAAPAKSESAAEPSDPPPSAPKEVVPPANVIDDIAIKDASKPIAEASTSTPTEKNENSTEKKPETDLGDDDDDNWEWEWKWVDVEDMAPVAIKLQYLLHKNENELVGEYDQNRQVWEKFANEGEIDIIAEARAYGDAMILKPDEDRWQAGCYVAIVFPLYISLNAVMMENEGSPSQERKRQLCEKAVTTTDRFNKHYVHMDVKFKNMVIDQYWCSVDNTMKERVLLIDIGGSKPKGSFYDEDEMYLMTYRYMCPCIMAHYVRGWMKNARFDKGEKKYGEYEWILLQGTVHAHASQRIWEEVDQWSLGIQILDWLNLAWSSSQYIIDDILRDTKATLQGSEVNYRDVELSLEQIGGVMDELLQDQVWKNEVIPEYHQLLSHCLQRPTGRGFLGKGHRDRRQGLRAALEALFIPTEEDIAAEAVAPAPPSRRTPGWKTAPTRISRRAAAPDALNFRPRKIDYMNGLTILTWDDNTDTYTASLGTAYKDGRLVHPNTNIFDGLGFPIDKIVYRCGLPGCSTPAYLGQTSMVEGVKMSRIKDHLDPSKSVKCRWFNANPQQTGPIPLEAETNEDTVEESRWNAGSR